MANVRVCWLRIEIWLARIRGDYDPPIANCLKRLLLALLSENKCRMAKENQKGMPEILSCGGPFRQFWYEDRRDKTSCKYEWKGAMETTTHWRYRVTTWMVRIISTSSGTSKMILQMTISIRLQAITPQKKAQCLKKTAMEMSSISASKDRIRR